MARGSRVTPVCRPKAKSCSTTTAASRNAASTSPTAYACSRPRLVGIAPLVRGACAAAAASTDATAGSSVQSTAISSTASSASARLSATTATTASPCQHASPRASGCWGGDTCPGNRASLVCHGLQTAARSSPVTTAMTPGAVLAASSDDGRDARMRVRAAQEGDVGDAGDRDVVGIAPLAGSETMRLAARHGAANPSVFRIHRRQPGTKVVTIRGNTKISAIISMVSQT